ncbi:MAG: hypothetical protein J6O50_06925 [Ruminiclostridium sp.]|nr:hypothetical protein [Ruminiclostridium sp.]
MRFVRRISAVFAAFVTAAVLSLTSFANAAQMHSVSIFFENIGSRELYASVFTERPVAGIRMNTGSIFIGAERHFSYEDAGEKIMSYTDSDGYVYCGSFLSLDGSIMYLFNDIPCSFKVLIYDPSSDTFSCSAPMKKYAVVSNFRIELGENGTILSQSIEYDFAGAVFSFICRMIFTVVVEILIALAFGYRDKRHLVPILITNTVTQLLLNLGLNLVDLFEFGGSFVGAWSGIVVIIEYGKWELIVFGAEALVYHILFSKTDKEYDRSVLYAFIANLVSFVCGAVLAFVIPGIF